MNLAEVRRLDIPERSSADTPIGVEPALQAAIDAWQEQPPSELYDHQTPCCALARQWLLAMDRSHTPGPELLTGPRWIRQRVSWGPSQWPLYWCEAMAAKTLDCGALAALAKNVFRERGMRSHTVQLIQHFTQGDGCHWACSWERAEVPPNWIRDELVYHEACAVELPGGGIRVWDPTASWWINPKHISGYGGARAVRVLQPDAEEGASFLWGEHSIRVNQWHSLEYRGVQPLTLVEAA